MGRHGFLDFWTGHLVIMTLFLPWFCHRLSFLLPSDASKTDDADWTHAICLHGGLYLPHPCWVSPRSITQEEDREIIGVDSACGRYSRPVAA